MKISVITPFSGHTVDLTPDYSNAVQGTEVIVIDNASSPETAVALDALVVQHNGILIRNETNLGFAAANNQGYAQATGDIIVFLNSDVAAHPSWLRALAADVQPGALYGPSLGHQLVAGRWMPYLEGWCIAATRDTWDCCYSLWAKNLQAIEGNNAGQYGPWDATGFPGPYWEDNDVCLRALQVGVDLVQTTWQVQHKGGRTAGPIIKHGLSFAQNEHTYTQRVLNAIEGRTSPPETQTYARYLQAIATPSDIQHHLPLLYSLARGVVVELGTRSGVSTMALLAGVERATGHVYSIDIDPDSAGVAAGHPLWTFHCGSSIDEQTVQWVCDWWLQDKPGNVRECNGIIDFLFIDTLHTYSHVKAELELWAKWVRPGGYICIHDPETFPGVRRATQEFCDSQGWYVTFVLPCNGMAVIKVPEYKPSLQVEP